VGARKPLKRDLLGAVQRFRALGTERSQNYVCSETIADIRCEFRKWGTCIAMETRVFYSVSCNWTPRWYLYAVPQIFPTSRNKTRSITTNCGKQVSPDAVFPVVCGDLGNCEHLLNPRCWARCLSCEALSVNVVTPLTPGVHPGCTFLHHLLHHLGGGVLGAGAGVLSFAVNELYKATTARRFQRRQA
jgi:hypothetical protein